MQTHNVHCKAGRQCSNNPSVQRGSMQLKRKNLASPRSCIVCCVSVCACMCVFEIKVFVNPALDSEAGDLLISASILIRPCFLTAALQFSGALSLLLVQILLPRKQTLTRAQLTSPSHTDRQKQLQIRPCCCGFPPACVGLLFRHPTI